jgi:hypothetical protein
LSLSSKLGFLARLPSHDRTYIGFHQIDDPVINAPAVSVVHLLLLAADFTGDQQLAVEL